MSVVAESQPLNNSDSEVQTFLRPAGNGVRVSKLQESKQKNDVQKKQQQMRKLASRSSESVHRHNVSVDSSCSSDSSRGLSSVKRETFRRKVKQNGLKSVKVVPDGVEVPSLSPQVKLKRCDWITPNTDPINISFHDEEWGVPVHDDQKLFEMLVLSEALAELSWPTILHKRDIFRKIFDNFDPTSVASFTEKKILALKATGSTTLSEPKLRAVVENARQIIKVQQEFGSFASYCWSFVNNKPIKNGFRFVRKVPVKTPKSEAISKDMMRRGFRCVGPSVVYSFMQVAGIVNDHLITCFRYQECNLNVQKDFETEIESRDVLAKDLEKTCFF